MSSTTFAPHTEMRLFDLESNRVSTAKVLENGSTFQVWPSKMTFNTTADWIAHQNDIHDERLSLFIEGVAISYVLQSDLEASTSTYANPVVETAVAATEATEVTYAPGTKLRLYKPGDAERVTTAVILKDGTTFQVWPTRGGSRARRFTSVNEWRSDWQDRRGELEMIVNNGKPVPHSTSNTPNVEEPTLPTETFGINRSLAIWATYIKKELKNRALAAEAGGGRSITPPPKARPTAPPMSIGQERAAAAYKARRQKILDEIDDLTKQQDMLRNSVVQLDLANKPYW